MATLRIYALVFLGLTVLVAQPAQAADAPTGSTIATEALRVDIASIKLEPHTRLLCLDSIKDKKNRYLQPSREQRQAFCTSIDPNHPLLANEHFEVLIRDCVRQLDSFQQLVFQIAFATTDQIDVAPVRQPETHTFLSKLTCSEKQSRYYLLDFGNLSGSTIPTYVIQGKVDPKTEPVTLIQQVLPQVHKPAYYAITTGVVWSSLKKPSFSRVMLTPGDDSTTPKTLPTYQTVSDDGTFTTSPILMFTAYIRPMDAERMVHGWDRFPRPSFGFSLTSPSTDFYFGGSSEVFRKVELVAGVHIGQVNYLSKQPQIPQDSATPPLIQRTGVGAFVGATFNVDFMTALFKK